MNASLPKYPALRHTGFVGGPASCLGLNVLVRAARSGGLGLLFRVVREKKGLMC